MCGRDANGGKRSFDFRVQGGINTTKIWPFLVIFSSLFSFNPTPVYLQIAGDSPTGKTHGRLSLSLLFASTTATLLFFLSKSLK